MSLNHLWEKITSLRLSQLVSEYIRSRMPSPDPSATMMQNIEIYWITKNTEKKVHPSKGRFLHPEQVRCISAREAALLQSFPPKYKFPLDAPVIKIALMIGNALPPKFSKIQAQNIRKHLEEHLG